MSVVLVHGNPETDALWGPLVASWAATTCPALPARLGCARAQGWGATLEEYRLWLVGELEVIGEPVDLVGHDWGGGHVGERRDDPARPAAQLVFGRPRHLRPRLRLARPRADLADAGSRE